MLQKLVVNSTSLNKLNKKTFVYVIVQRKEHDNFCNVNCVCSSKELTGRGCQAVSGLLIRDSRDGTQDEREACTRT